MASVNSWVSWVRLDDFGSKRPSVSRRSIPFWGSPKRILINIETIIKNIRKLSLHACTVTVDVLYNIIVSLIMSYLDVLQSTSRFPLSDFPAGSPMEIHRFSPWWYSTENSFQFCIDQPLKPPRLVWKSSWWFQWPLGWFGGHFRWLNQQPTLSADP